VSDGNYFLYAKLYRDALFEIMHRILQNHDEYLYYHRKRIKKNKRQVYIIIMNFFPISNRFSL